MLVVVGLAGDDAQGALGADEQVLEVVAGVVLDQAVERRDDGAVGHDRLDAEHHFARHAVADHPVAAGVDRRVAAQRRRAARAKVERKGQAVLVDRLLQRL